MSSLKVIIQWQPRRCLVAVAVVPGIDRLRGRELEHHVVVRKRLTLQHRGGAGGENAAAGRFDLRAGGFGILHVLCPVGDFEVSDYVAGHLVTPSRPRPRSAGCWR